MGMRMGGYLAETPLATGSSAVVWRGRAADGTPVAIKVFTAPAAQALPLARREAALAAGVDHPHLVRVLDVVGDGDAVGLVTALADGGSLADLLARRGRLTVGETLTVLLPLASALATAHERGVVHGDVTPANVVFDADGRPLLADLGAARAAVELAAPVSATPTHIAPEVARGGSPTPAADLFSLGAVALHCLSGRPAWAADDLRDVVVQATVGQWPDPDDDDGPAALLRVVRALLDAEPARRPGGAAVVIDLRRAGVAAPVDLAAGSDPAAGSGEPRAVTVLRSDTPRPAADPVGQRRSILDRVRAGSRPTGAHSVGAVGDPVDHDDDEFFPRVAFRPPGPASGPGVHRRGDQVRRAWPVAVVLLTAAALAVAGGLWWATWDRTEPVTAGPVGPGTTTATTATATVPDADPSAGPTASGSSSPASSPSLSSTSSSSSSARSGRDWASTVADLDAARAGALRDRDPERLDEVYLPGAAARAVDEKVIAGLRSRGLVVHDARHTARQVRLLAGEPEAVRVEVTDELPSYEVRDEQGRVVGRTPERAAERRVFVLRDTPDGYRIAEITDA